MANDQRLGFIRLGSCIVSIAIILLLFLGTHFSNDLALRAQSISNGVTDDKVVILTFDDGWKSQFTNAKPILDKYGFKAALYIVCNYIGNKPGYMGWNQVKQLNQDDLDIGSHSMNHLRLDMLSTKDAKFEVAQSKKCIEEHKIGVRKFCIPI